MSTNHHRYICSTTNRRINLLQIDSNTLHVPQLQLPHWLLVLPKRLPPHPSPPEAPSQQFPTSPPESSSTASPHSSSRIAHDPAHGIPPAPAPQASSQASVFQAVCWGEDYRCHLRDRQWRRTLRSGLGSLVGKKVWRGGSGTGEARAETAGASKEAGLGASAAGVGVAAEVPVVNRS